MRVAAAILMAAGLVALPACARDKRAGEPTELEPVEIELSFTTEAEFSPDYYYFFVFNFTNSPQTDENSRPVPKVSGPERGLRWERYIMFHGEQRTAANVVTLSKADVPAYIGTGRGPWDLLAADLNLDERLDVVTVNTLEGSVSVLLQQAGGRLAAHTEYTVGSQPVAAVAFRYDDDDYPDLAVSNWADSEEGRSVSVLRNNGSGGFEAPLNLPLPAQPYGIVAGEFTGDSLTDLAVVLSTNSEAGNRVAVLPRDADGFGEPVVTPVGLMPISLAVTDLDGNDLTDLAVVNSGEGEGGNSLMLLRCEGDGTFSVEHELTFPDRQPMGLAVGRINSDEQDDYAVTSSYNGEPGNTVLIFLSDGEGGVALDETIAVGHSPTDVMIGDLNGDGRADLVVVQGADDAEGNSVRRLLQGESGGFANAETYAVGIRPRAGILVDLDKDTHLDCVVAHSADVALGNSVAVLNGDGTGSLESPDSYWTDYLPLPISSEVWFRGATIGRNTITILLDPVTFRDLGGKSPESFLVDFMTFDTGIDYVSNPEDYGIELDWLLHPLVVEAEVGFETDEEREQLEAPPDNPINPPPEAANVVDWHVEVR